MPTTSANPEGQLLPERLREHGESGPRQLLRVPQTALVAVGIAFLSLGCGAARLRKANELALAEADRRVLEGCYDCLREARTVYSRVAHAKETKNRAGIFVRLFETEVLLALREKELALNAGATLERARTLVPRVPPVIEPVRVLAAVDAVIPDELGLATKTSQALRREHASFVPKIDDELVWLANAPLAPAVRRYLALSLDCSYPDRKNTSGDTANMIEKRREVPINAPPLVAYRAANCSKTDTLALKRVLVAAPGFDEAGYPLARVTMFDAEYNGGEPALALLARAYARFPRAPGLSYITGGLYGNLGECETAVRYLDETLALVPAHDRALLQKAVCLTNLQRDTAAIAAATQFIALETTNVYEGYYWRAVNRFRRKELDLARSDIEAAKARSRGGDVFTLAGIIEHEQADFPIAESDLRGARSAFKGSQNCTAAFYLGSVLSKREAWPDAAASFDSAMVCYDERANDIAMKIEEVRASRRGKPEYRAKRIAALETDLTDRRRRYRVSAFNTASMSARTGNLARAEQLLVIAADGPELTDQITKLRADITRASQQPATSSGQRAAPVLSRPK